MEEIWKDIIGYEGLYRVSDIGNVMSLYRNSLMTKQICTKGYYKVILTKNGKNRYFGIHRLLAKAFILNHENKPQVNHIDGIKLNNNKSNLEWMTAKENIRHAMNNGRFNNYGEKNHKSKLTAIDVIYIRSSELNRNDLAIKYGVSLNTIRKVILRKSWKHIPEQGDQNEV